MMRMRMMNMMTMVMITLKQRAASHWEQSQSYLQAPRSFKFEWNYHHDNHCNHHLSYKHHNYCHNHHHDLLTLSTRVTSVASGTISILVAVPDEKPSEGTRKVEGTWSLVRCRSDQGPMKMRWFAVKRRALLHFAVKRRASPRFAVKRRALLHFAVKKDHYFTLQ